MTIRKMSKSQWKQNNNDNVNRKTHLGLGSTPRVKMTQAYDHFGLGIGSSEHTQNSQTDP